jgi:hypothetical protein
MSPSILARLHSGHRAVLGWPAFVPSRMIWFGQWGRVLPSPPRTRGPSRPDRFSAFTILREWVRTSIVLLQRRTPGGPPHTGRKGHEIDASNKNPPLKAGDNVKDDTFRIVRSVHMLLWSHLTTPAGCGAFHRVSAHPRRSFMRRIRMSGDFNVHRNRKKTRKTRI